MSELRDLLIGARVALTEGEMPALTTLLVDVQVACELLDQAITMVDE